MASKEELEAAVERERNGRRELEDRLRTAQLEIERLRLSVPSDPASSSDLISALTTAIKGVTPPEPRSLIVNSPRRIDRFRDKPQSSSDPQLTEWIGDCKSHLSSRGITGSEAAAFVIENLGGKARQEVVGRQSRYNSPDEIYKILLSVFGDGHSLGQLRTKFYSYVQKANEDLITCSLNLAQLYKRIEVLDPSASAQKDVILKERLSESVSDESLQRELRRLNTESPSLTFFDLRDRALKWIGTSAGIKKASIKSMDCNDTLAQVLQNQGKKLEELATALDRLKQNSGSRNQQQRRKPEDKNKGRDSQGRRVCYKCKSLNHRYADCPERVPKSGGNSSQSPN